MLGDDRRLRAEHQARLAAWRAIPREGQIARLLAGPGPGGFPAALPPRRAASGKTLVGLGMVGCYLGGAEKWASDLLDHCDAARVEWAGVAYLDVPNVPTIPTVRADWEAHCPVGQGLGAIRELASRVDVLLTWGLMTHDLERAGVGGVSLVQASHSALDQPWVWQMAGYPGSISVAVSRAALRGLAPDRRAGARVIENGVSPARVARSRTRAEMLAEWGLPPDARVAGWLNRIAREKRPEAFVDAVAALPAGWSGVMLGAGLQAGATREYADRVAPGRVAFPGPTAAVGDALGAFDCHVMTTASEACSLSAAETWLAGVPLISTAVGLLEEHPGLARLVPNPPTGADVARAILADQADRAGTAARVEHAREFAGTRLSMARFGAEWTDLLCSLARPASPAPPPADARSAALARVAACPDRGPVLPISMQDDCGCRGKELSECRAGKGKVAGRVTLADCLACAGG